MFIKVWDYREFKYIEEAHKAGKLYTEEVWNDDEAKVYIDALMLASLILCDDFGVIRYETFFDNPKEFL